MQERVALSSPRINHDLLGFVSGAPLWFFVAAGGLGFLVLGFLVTFALMVILGLGILGINRPSYWGFIITDFVFWVGISHAGVMISAILRLTQAEWRRPVTRAAEVLTLFALGTAALHPVIHTGRPWRTIYWAFPYDFARGIWPDIRSPLIWDPSAIFTYLTGSSLFVYVAMIPDLAVVRDRNTGWRRTVYGILSLGFRGSSRQWRLQTLAGILLSGLILPVFVSVHSIVSWDFASTLTPVWHLTIFAPYFVIGAVHSGVSAVVTVMVILRTIFHLQDYITPDHFDALGRLLLVVSNTWMFFTLVDIFFELYPRELQDVAPVELRYFVYPYSVLSIIFFLTGYIIPVPLWFSRRIRRSIPAMFVTSILVNIGMWLERYLLFIPAMVEKEELVFTWAQFSPSLFEFVLIFGALGLVSLGFLTFAKIFPIIPLYDIKEGQVGAARVRVGQVEVPATLRE